LWFHAPSELCLKDGPSNKKDVYAVFERPLDMPVLYFRVIAIIRSSLVNWVALTNCRMKLNSDGKASSLAGSLTSTLEVGRAIAKALEKVTGGNVKLHMLEDYVSVPRPNFLTQ
jgi:hypothetical protein